jgi:GT2 family glycosyltransferase
MPLVSVVVPSYNRPELAERVLAALAEVVEPEGGFDGVIVDDGSRPAEAEQLAGVAERAGVLVVRRPNGGPSAARNSGIDATTGELVVFLDDDCAPERDWLVRLVEPFGADDPTLGAVGGRVRPAPPTNWAQKFCSAIEYATGEQPTFENASTQNACYRRSVLAEVGGFDEGFRHPGGDDPDLSTRTVAAGYRLAYAPDAVVNHNELETYSDFLRHMYHRGLGEARIGTKLGRRRRVLARVVLFPLFLGKILVVGWKRTTGKGARPLRVLWAVLEQGGYVAFLAGSAVGLGRESANRERP